MRSLGTIAAVVVLVLVGASCSLGQLHALETEHVRLLYNDLTHGYLAPHTARCFENCFEFYQTYFDYVPSEKVTIILDDSADYNNAAAWVAPRNTMLVQVSPTNRVYETSPSNERINHTLNHEMCHVVAQDEAVGIDRFFRTLFRGKVSETADHPESILYGFLTYPRRSAPRWYHEGIAVFCETWMAGGVGRGQGPWDEMVFRSMTLDGSRFYDPLGLESEGTKIDFQGGVNSYLYGTRFLSYLALAHSPEHLVDWASRLPGSKRYFASQFENVFGVSLDDAWDDWVAWEREFQRENLERIREYPVTPYHDLSGKALGSVSRAFYDDETRTLYAGLNYPGVVGHIAAISIDDGSVETLTEVKGPAIYFVTSLAFDPDSKTLFYTTDNYEWRDLCSLDPETHRTKRLMKDVRIGDIAFNRKDRSLWGVRHLNGISTLVQIPYPYEEWIQIHSWPYGRVLYDIDVSPDGEELTYSLSEINGRQTLHRVAIENLLKEEIPDEPFHDFGSSLPGNFVHSRDGEFIYGSSYYTGVSNIWRYNVDADSMEIVSNCETGLFRPVPVSADSVIVFRYTGEGFVPAWISPQPLQDVNAIEFLGYRVAEESPSVREWNVGSPTSVDLDSKITYQGEYHDLSHIGLATIYPVAEGYKNYGAAGITTQFSDPGYFNTIELTTTYTPTADLDEEERLHSKLKISRRGWTFTGRYNAADFYDLFGPTKTSRKGYSLGLGYERGLVHDTPKSLDLNIAARFHGDLERLPDAQNVTASYDKLWTAGADLTFRNLRASLGAVDHEKGYKWSVEFQTNYVNERSFPSVLGAFDVGVPLPVRNSSVWIRSSAGYGHGSRNEPFANFFFGGFGNNWVDHRSIKRYRESYAFPGTELNEIAGTDFAKTMLDLNLPPLRFRRFGIPSFYVTWARMSLFATLIATNLDSEDVIDGGYRRKLLNTGSQVDLRFTLLSRLKMTVSAGYATAFEEHRRASDELMVSLKIL